MYRTDKDILTNDDIIDYIKDYEANHVPQLEKYYQYYNGKDVKILSKKSADPNNPDNRTPVPYGRKIVTTFTGYAYRPRYITYKAEKNEPFMKELQITFDENNEHIKTSQHGRNTGIYGESYELLYIGKSKLRDKSDIKIAVLDPREVILIYDYSIEPEKKCAIRFYRLSGNDWQADVYYDSIIYHLKLERTSIGNEINVVSDTNEFNLIKEIPIIKYNMVDAMGVIEPVVPLIDDYDLLISDSMNEFDRFSHAYLRLVGMSLSDQVKSASPGVFKSALALLKYRRAFEQLKNKDDVSFLTKDIPTDYIKFMTELIREQIHMQSHVPDFGKYSELSGIAVQRLMFDFENVVSSAEAEFDTALYERIRIISSFYKTTGRASGNFDDVTISHKRNAPQNLKEFAETANIMKQANFSSYLIADIMPDDIIPNVDEELARQAEERDSMMPDIETMPPDPNTIEEIRE